LPRPPLRRRALGPGPGEPSLLPPPAAPVKGGRAAAAHPCHAATVVLRDEVHQVVLGSPREDVAGQPLCRVALPRQQEAGASPELGDVAERAVPRSVRGLLGPGPSEFAQSHGPAGTMAQATPVTWACIGWLRNPPAVFFTVGFGPAGSGLIVTPVKAGAAGGEYAGAGVPAAEKPRGPPYPCQADAPAGNGGEVETYGLAMWGGMGGYSGAYGQVDDGGGGGGGGGVAGGPAGSENVTARDDSAMASGCPCRSSRRLGRAPRSPRHRVGFRRGPGRRLPREGSSWRG
jgi:hypothetical protein